MKGDAGAAPRRSDWAASRPVASHAGTGCALPFSVSGTSSSYPTAWRVACMVRSPTVTVPGRPADCRREATFTVSPVTVYLSPTAPAMTSPVFTPTRSANAVSPGNHPLISSMQSSIASAARTARSASSSCATGAPNSAITLSPMYLSTVPPKPSTSRAQSPQRPIHHRLHGLRVHRLRHRRVARQVGEQHRDLAALVGRLRGCGWRCRCRCVGFEAGAAGHAELGLGGRLLTARRASSRQRAAAVHAEARLGRVGGAAGWTRRRPRLLPQPRGVEGLTLAAEEGPSGHLALAKRDRLPHRPAPPGRR